MTVIKAAFMFSGQGAQHAGMGKELYESSSVFKEVFDIADGVAGFSVTEMCFGEDSRLNETDFAQPCLLTHSMALYRLLRSKGIDAQYYLGLSLGEYTALTAAGVFDFCDAVRLVRKRGSFMTEAAKGFGGMSAILNLSDELTEKACEKASGDHGKVVCANYNTPGQLVISGENSALEVAEKLCLEYGAKRAIRLNVSGPFHSIYMQPAADRLEAELDKVSFGQMEKPVITNVTGREAEQKDLLQTLLKQIVSPVRWTDSINYLISQGVDTFVELGAGKTLSSFVKKINKEVNVMNIEDMKSLEAVLSAW